MNTAMARRQPAPRTGRQYRLSARMAVTLLTLAVALFLAPGLLHPARPVPPPAPLALQQSGPRGPLAPGAALNRGSIVLSFQAGSGSSTAVPEVELAAVGHPFTGRVSARGAPIAAGTQRTAARVVVAGLDNGVAYRWRVRLRGSDGRASRWVTFGAGQRTAPVSFLVDRTPPAAPALSSPSDPDTTAWYNAPLATVTWPAPRDLSGVAGYAYTLDRVRDSVPRPRLMLRRAVVNMRIPADGIWYVHVRAVDRAGNWGPTATYPLRVDLHPATLTVTFATTAFDPDLERERVTIALAHPGHLHLQIMDQYTGALVRTIDFGRVVGQTTLAWRGRDNAFHPAPEGSYRFLFTATDALGQQSVADYSDIILLRRRLVVSLSQQRMVAYDGTRAVMSTLVTTGNKLLPTPLGTFHILNKLHPFTFISPWPLGSPFYYPPSPVQYALLFDWNGFFIHDAPWRSHFGPGSNAQSGTPGQNNTGTHGCINVPPDVAAWLYTWAPIGTIVQVVP